jgi:glycosyltransferase involved in cell wall biosynthesis
VRDGVTGLLVPPRDVDAIADAVVRLLEEPGLRQRMGAAGREFVRQEYRWQDNIALMERLYDEMLQSASAATDIKGLSPS